MPHEAPDAEQEVERFHLLRRTALSVTLLTGATGLLYEVTWHRYLSNLLGSQARAAALILGVFLGGLCVGYGLFGKLSRGKSPRALLALCGGIEVFIGIWALAFPSLYSFVWENIGVLNPVAGASLSIDALVATALIALPTICMGGTLPLLTQGLSADLEDASPFHARVYAINTGGAFLGCLLTGLYLLPTFGLSNTMYIAGPLNLLAGGLLFIISCRLTKDAIEPTEIQTLTEDIPERHISYPRAAAVAFLAGFYSLTLQVVFIRCVGLAAGSSEYAFSMVVGAFILMLAFGAWRVAQVKKTPIPVWLNQLIVLVSAGAVYLTVQNWPYYVHVTRVLFSSVPPAFYPYHLSLFTLLCLVLLVPVGAMGCTMPLLFGALKNRFTDLGSDVGRLYSWNTVGCVLGAVFGGYLLLYYLQLYEVYRLCLLGIILTIPLSIPWSAKTGTFRFNTTKLVAMILLAVSCTIAVKLPDWPVTRMASGLFRARKAKPNSFLGPDAAFSTLGRNWKPLVHEDGPNTSVTIMELLFEKGRKSPLFPETPHSRSLLVNGKSDGNTGVGDMVTMRLSAHIPMLLSSNEVQNAAVIGFGLGTTIGTLTLYPEVQDVHCIEISPLVKKHSHFFDFANHEVSRNPKVRWSIDDAYRILGGQEEKYSLIISEPSNPWVAGVERLFSSEFYSMIRSRLKPKGVYAQWVQLYEISEQTIGLVFATFGESFPYVRLFELDSDIILVGSDSPFGKQALTQLETRYYNLPEVQNSLKTIGVPSPEALLAKEVWISAKHFAGDTKHSLEHPKLSFSAGRDFFSDPRINLNTLMHRRNAHAWRRRTGSRSLIGLWLQMGRDKPEILKNYAKEACDIKEIQYPRNWRKEPKRCKDVLVAMEVLGMFSGENGPSVDDIDILRLLVDIPDIGERIEFADILKDLDARGAAVLVKKFAEYDSPFLPLSVDKIIEASTKCTLDQGVPARVCRFATTEALAKSGYGKIARALFTSLEKRYTGTPIESEIISLRTVVESAEQAEKTLPLVSLSSAGNR